LVDEDGEEIFVVLTHISETGSGKEEIKLLFGFLVGFYHSSSDRLLNGRFERKSTFFLIAGFFGLVLAFVRVELFFHNSFLNLLNSGLVKLLLKLFLKWAFIVSFWHISILDLIGRYWLNWWNLRIFVLILFQIKHTDILLEIVLNLAWIEIFNDNFGGNWLFEIDFQQWVIFVGDRFNVLILVEICSLELLNRTHILGIHEWSRLSLVKIHVHLHAFYLVLVLLVAHLWDWHESCITLVWLNQSVWNLHNFKT